MTEVETTMNPIDTRLVGNSFKLGFRTQRYWDQSMAKAFFCAEVGTGLYLVSCWYGSVLGMAAGLVLAGTLKPYFHLAHMGVPRKSWRAVLRPDRSWISRGAIAIGVLIGFGALHLIDAATGLLAGLGLGQGVSHAVETVAVAAALVVMCYQGLAMAHSESFTLWASTLVPVSSFCYSLTAGLLATRLLAWNEMGGPARALLSNLALAMLVLDLLAVIGILAIARGKSRGGAFSVEMLLAGEFAAPFLGLVVGVGLVIPVALMAADGMDRWGAAGATVAMLVGFFAFRLLMFKAAVFEPITHDLAGSIGLPSPDSRA